MCIRDRFCTLHSLANIYSYAFAVCCKPGSVHALNGCNAVAEVATVCYKHRVFKNVSAFCKPAKKEVGACIFGTLIISETALVFILADNIYRLHARCPHISVSYT